MPLVFTFERVFPCGIVRKETNRVVIH